MVPLAIAIIINDAIKYPNQRYIQKTTLRQQKHDIINCQEKWQELVSYIAISTRPSLDIQ